MSTLEVPELCLVVLIGTSGSGKSTFAATHFAATEVVSSDECRALVSDDPNDQDATKDAFAVLEFIAGKRLGRGRLTVVDATNVQASARRSLLALAKEHDVLVVAIVLDVPAAVAIERNAGRGDRDFGTHVIRRQHDQLRRSLKTLRREGFRTVHVLDSTEAIAEASIVRTRLFNDRRDERGPFDVIGDVHGCREELEELLVRLGYALVRDTAGRPVDASHPDGRRAVFVGDLVDRGPDSPGVLRLVMGMVAEGHALCVSGNHEAKLVKALRRQDVRATHGLQETLDQLAAEDQDFVVGGRRDGCARSPCTATPAGRPTSSACPSDTRGPRTTAARRPCCTGTPRCPSRSGSTTRCASTRAACSAAASRRCGTPSGRSWPYRRTRRTTGRCVRWHPRSAIRGC
jgi:predicted kinase